MARILNRPMFRKGGSANEGIMHGLVNRRGYETGTNPWTEEALKAYRQIERPRDTSLSEMLVGGGLNLVSGRGAGSGLMLTLLDPLMNLLNNILQVLVEPETLIVNLKWLLLKQGLNKNGN